jgi:hypothetical protein
MAQVKQSKGIVSLPFEEKQALIATDATKKQVKEAWLKKSKTY